MGRSIAAIAIGFVVIFALNMATGFALSAVDPELFPSDGRLTDPVALLVSTVTVAIYAIAGCYLTARLAPAQPMQHALILGALGLLVNLAFLFQLWGAVPSWYLLVNLALVMPYAWIGGRLREAELARTAPTS